MKVLKNLKKDYVMDTISGNKPIGRYTISELYPLIDQISKEHNLKPNRVKEFKLIIKLISIRYNNGCHNCYD